MNEILMTGTYWLKNLIFETPFRIHGNSLKIFIPEGFLVEWIFMVDLWKVTFFS